MTTAPITQDTRLAPDLRSAPEEQPLCLVCAHDLAGHDPIAARFCRATQSQALSRGCICR